MVRIVPFSIIFDSPPSLQSLTEFRTIDKRKFRPVFVQKESMQLMADPDLQIRWGAGAVIQSLR